MNKYDLQTINETINVTNISDTVAAFFKDKEYLKKVLFIHNNDHGTIAVIDVIEITNKPEGKTAIIRRWDLLYAMNALCPHPSRACVLRCEIPTIGYINHIQHSIEFYDQEYYSQLKEITK